VSYNPNHASLPSKKQKKSKKYDKNITDLGINIEYNSERKISEEILIKESNSFTPKNKRKMTLDEELNLRGMKLSDITEVKNDFEIENDYGNREYKLKLCDIDQERIEELVTQMKFRLEEGGGECFYQIGVEDNGNPLGVTKDELELSVENLKRIVDKLNASANITNLLKGKMGLIAEVIIKKNEDLICNDKLEIKAGLLGEEGCGKSTLVYILII
jgi:hypothetical protein